MTEFDQTVECHICLGEGKVQGTICAECNGEGRYDYYRYRCSYDDSEFRNELIYPGEPLIQENPIGS